MTNSYFVWRATALALSLLVMASVVAGDVPDPPDVEGLSGGRPGQAGRSAGWRCRDGLIDAQVYMDKSRQITRDAHTLAALALVLAKHDQDHRLKARAQALLTAAQQLAKAKEYAAAKRAFEAVEDAANGEAPVAAADVKWERIAGLGQMMKQVTFVNNRLRRNMRRFEDRADDNRPTRRCWPRWRRPRPTTRTKSRIPRSWTSGIGCAARCATRRAI